MGIAPNFQRLMDLSKVLRVYSPTKLIVLAVLCVLLVVGALPHYLQGRWTWVEPPQVSQTYLKPLQQVAKKGITVPAWNTLEHKPRELGAGKWLLQKLEADGSEAWGERQRVVTLLLRPQTTNEGASAQPQMEWIDVNSIHGLQGWKTDSDRSLKFTVPGGAGDREVSVEARFFRGWTRQQTYALVEWYAWSDGGHPSFDRWFWLDRRAQLQGRRVPWTAVAILIPLEPLGDIETVRPLAESLGQKVQAQLISVLGNGE
jgi:cyanoexosortase B-associated protein